ncbi:MAG: hypothetical protein GY796_18640 [Chloroflexi bacterium]|nr:hypothetical protein [Chloroflexota bacterium]
MNSLPIQVRQDEVIIPLTYFPHAEELELVVEDDVAIVRAKTGTTRFHKNERRAEMLEQTAVFESQRRELWQQYPEEYAAFHQGKLVDHDADHRRLRLRIDAQYPDQIVLIRQITAEPPAPLRLGSPRLIP